MHKSSGLPPLHFLQKSSTICLRYFITPSKAFLQFFTAPPSPLPHLLANDLQYMTKMFQYPYKNPLALVCHSLQNAHIYV